MPESNRISISDMLSEISRLNVLYRNTAALVRTIT